MGLADIEFNFGKKGPDKAEWSRIFCALKEDVCVLRADVSEIKKKQYMADKDYAVHVATLTEQWKQGCEPVKEIRRTQELIKKILSFVGLLSLGNFLWIWLEKK